MMYHPPVFLFIGIAAATEVVVDDEDGAPTFTTTTANWDTWSLGAEGFDGSDTSYHYLTAYAGDGSRRGTATWTPSLPTAGTWRVETWFRRTDNRTADADHYVRDRDGVEHHVSIDQRGSGGSGWISLGEYACAAGDGGCTVTLDGDDGASDEANAMRFTLVAADGTASTDPCAEAPAPGPHTWELPARAVADSGWDAAAAAAGDADGDEATSENVDAGEYLRASGWDVCDPPGEETITAVRLSVRGRTQYDSGTYEVVLALTDGAERATWNGTSAAWHTLPLSDRAWTWDAIAALTATVELEEHPGGRRDSDAWVDAFRLEVDYTTLAADTGTTETDSGAPADTGPTDTGPADTGPADTDTGAAADTARRADTGDAGPHGGAPGAPARLDTLGCGGGAAGLLPLAWLVSRRRRRPGPPAR